MESVTFTDIATEANSGINYARVESTRKALFDELTEQPIYTFEDAINAPSLSVVEISTLPQLPWEMSMEMGCSILWWQTPLT